MNEVIKRSGVVLAISVLSTGAIAALLPVHPACPGQTPTNSWPQYLAGQYPRTPKFAPAVVGVQFRTAKSVADPAAMDNLPTNQCYVVRYIPGKGYESFGEGKNNAKLNLPGNPLEWEVNVHGTIFLFTASGQLLDKRGRPVGVFVCYLDTNYGCNQY